MRPTGRQDEPHEALFLTNAACQSMAGGSAIRKGFGGGRKNIMAALLMCYNAIAISREEAPPTMLSGACFEASPGP